ncbi:hypothetical protein WA577_004348, partial [Blastocystis sp. JDR]
SEASIPEGRKVAEGILEAAKQLNTHPTQMHAENDPYYWEPEYPDDQADRLGLLTIVGHNLHYAYMSTYNFMANVGYRIMDFLGWSGSDYDWIQAELDRDKEEEEMQKREREEERQFVAAQNAARIKRHTDALERGEK